MADIYVYAYVEDEPTKAVLKKMIEYVNSYSRNRFLFLQRCACDNEGVRKSEKYSLPISPGGEIGNMEYFCH